MVIDDGDVVIVASAVSINIKKIVKISNKYPIFFMWFDSTPDSTIYLEILDGLRLENTLVPGERYKSYENYNNVSVSQSVGYGIYGNRTRYQRTTTSTKTTSYRN